MATASQPLIKAPFDLDASLWGFATRELAPAPGRLEFAARTAVTAATMLLIGETCRSQDLFVALFIPLLLPRGTPQQTWAAAKGTIIVAWAACAGAAVLVLLTADLPWARVLALASAIFVCMILSRGLHQPSIAALGPVVVSEVLIRMDSVNSAEVAITSGLWMALMMSAGCLVATAVDFVMPHPGPRKRITEGITDRLAAAAAVCKKFAGAELSREEQQRAQAQGKLALAGTSSLRKLLPALSTQLSIDKNYVLRLTGVLGGLDLLSDHAVQLLNKENSNVSEEQKSFASRLAQSCEGLADRIHRNAITPPEDSENVDSALASMGRQGPGQLLAELGFQLDDLWRVWCSGVTASKDAADTAGTTTKKAAKAAPQPGPFVTPDDIRFAIKVTLASMICYVLYNGIAWQGISTSLLTCYLTADTTIGGTYRKLALRIAGVLVGGLLFGIVGIVFVTSHMDNIVEFMLYVAVVFFTAGWVTKGSPRIAYAGSQIGISFGLVALMTTVIPTLIVEPRDRLVGVLLGTVVMWFVFSRIWPVDTLIPQRKAIASLIGTASELVLLTVENSPAEAKSAKKSELRDVINQGITKAEDQADLSSYETKAKEAIQAALRKCLAQTQNVLTLEIAEVDLTIRFSGKVSSTAAFDAAADKDDAQRAAQHLCHLAKQIVDGRPEALAHLKEEERQFYIPGNDAAEDKNLAEENGSAADKAFLLARANIRRRRSSLLHELFQSIEEATLSAP